MGGLGSGRPRRGENPAVFLIGPLDLGKAGVLREGLPANPVRTGR